MSARLLLLGLLMLLRVPLAVGAECKVQTFAEFPVTMSNGDPLVSGSINGTPVKFVLDSGAFFSTLFAASSDALHLKRRDAHMDIVGVDGRVTGYATTAKELRLDGLAIPIPNIDFVVVPGEYRAGIVGLLGQNILRAGDIEYDLANGVVRLFKITGCKDRLLAYWATDRPVSVLDIRRTTAMEPHLISTVQLNGKPLRVTFDTGASRSLLNRAFAQRVGFDPAAKGVEEGGVTSGIAMRPVDTWIAPFGTLDLGDEQIKNARLRVAKMASGTDTDMLLGADFFLSHRVLVSFSQRKLYFTYNGGRVFDLRATHEIAQTTPLTIDLDPTLTSDDYRRRGAAALERNELALAIANFDAAIHLEPNNADAHYRRALAYRHTGDAEHAMSDISDAITADPHDLTLLLTRAGWRLGQDDLAGANADFAAADAESQHDAELQLRIASTYLDAGHADESIRRLDDWLVAHPKHDLLARTLNQRCWARAVSGQALEIALNDCNAALKIESRNAAFLDSRGLVLLRLGKYDDAIRDYTKAVKQSPKSAWSHYGLGLAQMRKGLTAESKSHIDTALALMPTIADEFKRIGLAAEAL